MIISDLEINELYLLNESIDVRENMNIRIEKYGGSSVANSDKIKKIAKSLTEKQRHGKSIIVVVSAMGKTTNGLISLSEEISDHNGKREMDQLLVAGEQISIAMMAMAIQSYGGKAVSLTGTQAGINTVGPYGQAKIDDIDRDKIQRHLDQGNIVVVAGFQGVNGDGDITTLGRGGSDITATALAGAFHCPCYIYTDVDGIHTVDPKRFPRAKRLNHLTYDDALEMAKHGAKIMEPHAVEIAKEQNVIVYIKETFGSAKGTVITRESPWEQDVLGMTVFDDIYMAEYRNNNGSSLKEILQQLKKASIATLFCEEITDDASPSLRLGIKSADIGSMNHILSHYELNPSYQNPQVEMITVIRREEDTIDNHLLSLLQRKGFKTHLIAPTDTSISFVVDKAQSPSIIQEFGTLLNL